jgi:radical SAM protein with 4Fe4S-binding SPASM domain
MEAKLLQSELIDPLCLDEGDDLNVQPTVRRPVTVEDIRVLQSTPSIPLLEVNITTACQLLCPGCYKEGDSSKERVDLPFDRYKEYIRGAIDFGLKEVWLLGGEPTLHKQWREFFAYARSQGIKHMTLFSNMLALTEEDLEFLKEYSIILIGKLSIGNIDDPSPEEFAMQSKSIGKNGVLTNKMLQKIRMVLDSGLQNEGLFGVENLLRKENLPFVLDFWQFCRENNIIPNLELFCDVGKSEEDLDLPSQDEISQLIESLRALDKTFTLEDWTPMVPHVTQGCTLNYTALAVDPNESVLPCAASKTEIANFAGKPVDFGKVLEHPIMKARRNLTRENVKGACNGCDIFDEGCFGGCRNAVEIQTGDPFEGYNNCFINNK